MSILFKKVSILFKKVSILFKKVPILFKKVPIFLNKRYQIVLIRYQSHLFGIIPQWDELHRCNRTPQSLKSQTRRFPMRFLILFFPEKRKEGRKWQPGVLTGEKP